MRNLTQLYKLQSLYLSFNLIFHFTNSYPNCSYRLYVECCLNLQKKNFVLQTDNTITLTFIFTCVAIFTSVLYMLLSYCLDFISAWRTSCYVSCRVGQSPQILFFGKNLNFSLFLKLIFSCDKIHITSFTILPVFKGTVQ